MVYVPLSPLCGRSGMIFYTDLAGRFLLKLVLSSQAIAAQFHLPAAFAFTTLQPGWDSLLNLSGERLPTQGVIMNSRIPFFQRS